MKLEIIIQVLGLSRLNIKGIFQITYIIKEFFVLMDHSIKYK
jgi:hypothetical protein